ncbi:hypothetical protein ACQ4LK_21495, partial [Bacillus pumilus]
MKFFTGEIHSRMFIGVVIDDEWVMDVKKAEAKLFELETLPNSLACLLYTSRAHETL